MTETTPATPALSSLELVKQLAEYKIDESLTDFELQGWVGAARKTMARAVVVEDNEKLRDLKETCEKMKERIQDFADTLENMMGHGMAGPGAPIWLASKGCNLTRLEQLSRRADILASAFEAWVDDYVEPLESAEVD